MGLKRCALWARGWEGKKKKATCTKRTSAYTKLQKKKKPKSNPIYHPWGQKTL